MILAVLIDLSSSGSHSFLIILFFILLYYGRLAFAINKQYTVFNRSEIFPVINEYGVTQVSGYADGGRYVTISDAKWEDIKAVRFYSDFISIEIKNRKDIKDGGCLIYIMTEDALQFKDAVAYLWSEALKDPKDKFGLILYSEKEEKEVSDYIKKHFGIFENVLHEIVSPDIHVDIAMIPSSDERDYITLCTIGAGAYKMEIDDETRINYGLPDRAEYAIFLPSDWKLDSESLKDERYYWPLRVLKDSARLPIWTESWLGYGHTISPADGELLTEGMPYNSALLTYPTPGFDTMQYADLTSGKSVNFFQLHPLTPEELEYKTEHGTSDLLGRIYPEGCDIMQTILDRMKS